MSLDLGQVPQARGRRVDLDQRVAQLNQQLSAANGQRNITIIPRSIAELQEAWETEGIDHQRSLKRDTILHLLREMNVPVQERSIARDELYVADEVFMCGTAAEVTPVREVDDRKVGSGGRGPITQRIQSRYFEVVRGQRPPKPEWLAYV